MLSKQDNETMCRTGPGTPMGDAMRRFWMPVAHATDLPESGGDPKVVELLGERFLLWRDGEGRPGLFAEGCLHRGASLQLARSEPDGLRCIYHGWKFAVDGKVLETPNVADPRFRERIKGRTFPVQVAGGLVWAYLGPKDKVPEFPHYPFMDQPDERRINVMAVVNCNFVQVIEGLVDSSHLTILHAGALAQTSGMDMDFARKTTHMQFDASPDIEADETDFGFHYVALRTVGDKRMARIASFIAPCFLCNANGDLWFAMVPVNDERCNFYHVWWHAENRIGIDPLRSRQLNFVGLDEPTLERFGMTPGTCDTPAAMTWRNGYGQDRVAQRGGHFSGLHTFTQEDAGCSISAGPIRDRSQEMLSSADLAITQLYRSLLACIRGAKQGGVIAALAADVGSVVGTSGELEPGQDWRSLVPHHKIVSSPHLAASRAAA
ncbi:MAG TPA: Rieske 2Fe-2S domain-containing protein [Ramlibacter sp.]|uniref:Rieske 2Fe-2S domain-containing protein n=1 Tax=Ramlibacter sp. TaxID=1917967 RepID=UPI002C5DA0A5|nr:Rieske 2Fe-2S domain-containing protein [Ramlibacter sp.]HVZ45761.1 Rieske 2Fe-2S domain-containing protein [Ramlibacter sp.]